MGADTTIIKETTSEDPEIIIKKGKKIKAMRVTKTKATGDGERLGTIYRLQDGNNGLCAGMIRRSQ